MHIFPFLHIFAFPIFWWPIAEAKCSSTRQQYTTRGLEKGANDCPKHGPCWWQMILQDEKIPQRRKTKFISPLQQKSVPSRGAEGMQVAFFVFFAFFCLAYCPHIKAYTKQWLAQNRKKAKGKRCATCKMTRWFACCTHSYLIMQLLFMSNWSKTV